MARGEDDGRGRAGAVAAGLRASGRGLRTADTLHHLHHHMGRHWHAFLALWAYEVEHRIGFLWLPVAFGAGILAYFALPVEPALWQGLVLAGVMLVPALLDTGWRRVLAMALVFAALGLSAATWRTQRAGTPMLTREIFGEVRGYIEVLERTPGRQRLTLRPTMVQDVPAGALPAALRIGAPAGAELTPGDFVVLRARLAPPSEAAMPLGYDFRRDAFFKGIGGMGYAAGVPRVEAAPGPVPWDLAFNAFVDRGRNWLTDRIANAIGGQAGALAAALITGKRGLISEATNDDLRASGLYHVVSISGLHMVLAAGVLFWSVRALLAMVPGLALRWPIKKIAALFAMGGAIFYDIFSGSEVATERSLIMTLVMLGAILVDRPALAMRNLALSALLVLAREPEALVGPSFQMSFAAVACLIAANRVWQDWRRHRPPPELGMLGGAARGLWLAFLGMAATTLVATIATGPFSVFHFHRVNPFGLIGNALALPLVSLVVMPCAVLGTLLAPLGLDWVVWRVMGEGVGGVLFVAERVGAIENASYPIARLTLPAFALMVLALLLFVNFRTRLRALALVPLALLVAVPLTLPGPDLVMDPQGRNALVRGGDGAYRLLAPNAAARFTLSQWLPALGDARAPRDVSLREGVRCDKGGCTLAMPGGRMVALSLTPAALREDCTRAAVLVTPLAAPGGCAAPLLFDKRHFEARGATFVTWPASGPAVVQATLDPASRRPWRRTPPTSKEAGTMAAPLAGWVSPDLWPRRADGRRFFGLLPPEPAREVAVEEEEGLVAPEAGEPDIPAQLLQ